MIVWRRLFRRLSGLIVLGAVALAGCSGLGDKAGGARKAAPMVLTLVNTRGGAEFDKFVEEGRQGKIRFVTASPADVDRLRAAFGPVYSWLRQEPQTKSFLRQISSMRAGETSAAPAETPSCATAMGTEAAPAAVRTPVDGVYRMTTTRADLAGIAPDDEGIPQSHGAWDVCLRPRQVRP